MLIIGERLNAQGSRAVRQMLLDGNDAGIVDVARQQVAAGAAALDVFVALPDDGQEAERMSRIVNRLAASVDVPIAIDSTDPRVFEHALAHVSGRAVVNSINIGGHTRVDAVMPLVLAHDASVIALCIDEQGMARTRQRKLEIARRLRREIVDGYGLAPDRLLIDPLTFPAARSEQGSDVETVEAVRLIATEMPDVRTVLGISDVSFGLPAAERRALNVAFLRRCADAGLHAAIVDPADVARAQRRAPEGAR